MDYVISRLKGKVRNIAVMGGTFDPIHFGHLMTAETVRVRYNYDRVLFIPSGSPPHKDNSHVTYSEHRYMMAQLAVSSNPYFEVSRMEIDREGYTYTVDTISELKSILGEDVSITFITGADAMFEILTWKDTGRLLSLCKFFAVTRPGYNRSALECKVAELNETFKSDIALIDVPAFDISSTDIRNRTRHSKSIKYLVPDSVENYIIKNNLYIKPE